MVAKPDEGKAISDLGKILSPFEPEAQGRILQWAFDAYKVAPRTRAANGRSPKMPGTTVERDGSSDEFTEIGALFEAANPTSTQNRVLVATYWFQQCEGQQTVKGQTVNDALKNLGHAVANITKEFTRLMKTKPQLVRQAAKHGKAQQGRKEYKLTAAGLDHVQTMIGAGGDDTTDDEE
jgi:hypothetical protein